MRFPKHLFISYAHIDNQPLSPEQQGWISRFHASLEALLGMRLGQKASIWRDDKLQGNDIFADEIVEQFSKTAVLVSVLTPRYLKSEWCTREVSEFCKSAEQSGGLVVDNKARIFKVLKTPVETQDPLPAAVKDTLGYEFYTFEDETPLELDPAYGEKFAQDYNRKVGKLAWDISQLLKKLEAGTTGSTGLTPASANQTIYLAECSYDQKESREILEGELKRHGYPVLPDRPLPRDEDAYVAAVTQLLERCDLSVHLVGKSYGAVPDGPSQKSVVVLQNELAVQQSKNAQLSRVIWLPEGIRSEQPQQQQVIEALHQDAEVQYGADLITGDLESLKTTIHATLNALQQPAKPASEARSKLIYLICTEQDRKATVPLRKYLKELGFDVALPVFEGAASAVRETHLQLLTTSDAIILFYGAGDEAWKRTIGNELKKMPGYRNSRPLLANFTYLAEPRTSDKDDLIDMEEPDLINGFENFSAAQLAAFIQTLGPAGASI